MSEERCPNCGGEFSKLSGRCGGCSLPYSNWPAVQAKNDEIERLKAMVADLERMRAEVIAGCDIQKGQELYRQVRVVLGPGLTEDQIEIQRLKAELAAVKKPIPVVPNVVCDDP